MLCKEHTCYINSYIMLYVISVRDLRQMVTFWRILACLQRVPFTIVKI